MESTSFGWERTNGCDAELLRNKDEDTLFPLLPEERAVGYTLGKLRWARAHPRVCGKYNLTNRKSSEVTGKA
eukprot:12307553-Ditylum_brightwellii.AAC.1